MERNSSGRRVITIYVAVALLALFVLLGMFVRVPYVALGPGPTVNTLGAASPEDPESKRVVKVVGAVDPDPAGHLNLTTVSLYDGLTLFGALGKWVSSSYELQPRETYYPPGQSEEEVRQRNIAQMSSSEDHATLAALNYLKRPAAVGVTDVVDESPAAGVLEKGDRVTSIAGTPVSSMEQMAHVIAEHRPGEPVEVAFGRSGAKQTATVTLGERPDGADGAFLGVTMRAVPANPSKDIRFHVGDIGGPSAGLMLTLAIIDQMTPGDLSHGEFIAGTGTIDRAGEVGEIGGINHKVLAAHEAGATTFLVPEGNCALASAEAPDGIDLVKVGTLTEAMDALAGLAKDQPVPHC